MTTVCHAVDPSNLTDILKHGLKRTSRGDKGEDRDIIQTDSFLDDHCPNQLRQKNVSRDNNLYAYLIINGKIADITDGQLKPLNQFITQSKDTVIKLTVDPARCFVSDLDAYDALKNAMSNNEPQVKLLQLATYYWSQVTPLTNFSPGIINRPEVMITYDISPHDITVIE